MIAQRGTTYQVRMYNDFYPYGKVISGGTEDYRYDYQGQYAEKDGETGWNSYQLRMYNSRLGRWFQRDPAGQFSSPYVGMGNNPVIGADKDGGIFGTLLGAALGGLIEGISYKMEGKNFWEGAKRGAIRGAIAGAVFDAAYTGGTSLIAVGAFSGAISEMADQTFFGDGKVHFDRLAVSTVTGGVGGMFMEAAAPVSRGVAGRLIRASVQAVEGPSSMGIGDEVQKIYDNNITHAHDPQNITSAVEPAPTPAPAPAANELVPTLKGLTTSSKDMRPAVLYRVSSSNGTLYKFGESLENLDRAMESLEEAGEGATGTYSIVIPKYQVHIMEKYMRSLHFNSSFQWTPAGQWELQGMTKPFPRDLTTGKPIGP